jgi:hypothetical protein
MARDRGMPADFPTRDAIVDRAATPRRVTIDGFAARLRAVGGLERVEATDRARLQLVDERMRRRHPPIASAPPVVGVASRGMSPTIANHRNGEVPPCSEADAWGASIIANHSDGEVPPCGEAGVLPSRTIANHRNGEVPPCGEAGARAARTIANHSNDSPLDRRWGVLPPPREGRYGWRKGRVKRG